jgi:F0F1-type ATP synthase membrane subunit b/b'
MASQSDRMSGYGTPSPQDRPTDPDAIRREIDRTRAELAGDVDRLADRASPKRVVRRNVDRLGSRFSNMKESVMGAPRSAGSSVHEAAGSAAASVRDAAGSASGSVRDAAGTAAGAVREAPHTVARQTRGNPLAVGLIAFGAGLVAASLIPPSQAEKQAGQKISEHSDDLLDKVREPFDEIKQDVTDSARESVQQVKDTARDAAQTTAQSTKQTAQNTADNVKQS